MCLPRKAAVGVILGLSSAGSERRVAVALGNYWLNVSVGVVSLARRLAAEGFVVDVFADPASIAESPVVDFSRQGVNVVTPSAQRSGGDRAGVSHVVKSKLPSGLLQLARSAATALAPFSHRLSRMAHAEYSASQFMTEHGAPWSDGAAALVASFRRNRYDFVLAVEPAGLVSTFYALDVVGRPQTPVVYYNLELMGWERGMRLRDLLLKDAEVWCSRRCRLVFTPDAARGRVLLASNGLDARRMRYLAVTVDGDPIMERSDYFRARFGLDEDQVIVIYAGNVRPWAMCLEIVEAAASWPSRYVLVIHSWQRHAAEDAYYKEVERAAEGGRVLFSKEPIAEEDFGLALSSADVGLALYRPIDANFTETGSSSNKLAQYARSGVPVVASDFASISEVLDRYHSGIAVRGADGISQAVDAISGHSEAFRQGALTSFREHYSFDHAVQSLLPELKSLGREND